MKRTRDNTGKYVLNPDKGVGVSLKVPRSLYKKLIEIKQEGETISDKINEAIAFYLQHHGNCELDP